MKKLMFLAMMAAPVVTFAQEKKDGKEADKKVSVQQNAGQGEDFQKSGLNVGASESMFMELILTESQNGTLIRADFGREILSNCQDKELVGALTEFRTLQLTNVPDAMAHLNSLGFKLTNSYETHRGDKTDTHLVFEKRNNSKRPGQEGQTRPAVNTQQRPVNPPAPAPAPADGKGKGSKKEEKK